LVAEQWAGQEHLVQEKQDEEVLVVASLLSVLKEEGRKELLEDSKGLEEQLPSPESLEVDQLGLEVAPLVSSELEEEDEMELLEGSLESLVWSEISFVVKMSSIHLL
jgi:hypothetical protein